MYKNFTHTEGVRHWHVHKILLIMKLTTFILLVGMLQISVAAVAQKVSLSEKNTPLAKIFKKISQQTGYGFLVEGSTLKGTSPVTIQVNNAELKDVLALIFKDQPLEFSLADNVVSVSKKEIPSFFDRVIDRFKAIDIHGRVTDSTGTPLVGASIKVKGTDWATTSGAKGYFTLTNVTDDAILLVTYVGYQPIEIKVSKEITIILKASTTDLKEVLVNKGYYTTSKEFNTGSVSTINSSVIAKQPVTNPLASLIGRMPGVNVRETSGLPGAPFNIEIRGKNSLRSGANEPLYVIDGVPFLPNIASGLGGNLYSGPVSAINSVNPDDIENIEILKDADATSIYGSRGANGVVLITTKKGIESKTQFEVNASQGVGKVAGKMDLLNTQQYIEMRKEAFLNDKDQPTLSNAADLLQWDQKRYTDWQKVLIGGSAKITNVQGSFFGGNATTHFRAGGGYYRQTTVFPGDFAFLKASGHINLDHNSADGKFRINVSVSYVNDSNNLMNENLVNSALSLAPNAPEPYLASGELNWSNSTWQNPYSYLKRKYKAENDNLIAGTTLSYQITSGLQIRGNLGYTLLSTEQSSNTPASSFDPAYNVQSGDANFGTSSVKTWILEPQLQYDRKVGQGTISTLLGGTFQQNNQQLLNLGASGFTNDALLDNPKAATNITVYDATTILYRYNGFYGRINYNLKEKYLINLTARRDGSSRFGPDRQFANFGAIGAAWLFYKESFFENHMPFLSFGKLRASYGTSGSDQIPDYGYLDSYTPTSLLYNGNSGLYPTRLFNNNYSWESNKKLDIAMEGSILHNRVSFTLNWFLNRSSNQLVGYPLSAVTGQSSIQYNLPATVQNSGWEFEIESSNIKRPNFSWRSSFNLTIPFNKLVSYPGLAGSSYANTYFVGQPLSIQKTYHYIDVDPAKGTYVFEDIDKNGILNAADQQTIVFVGQKYFGGVQNTFRFKGLELDFLLQFVKQTGSDYKKNVFTLPGFWGYNIGNQPAEVMERWRQQGNTTHVQKFSQDLNSSGEAYTAFLNSQSYGENAYQDASFIRLKNISLSWKISSKNSDKKTNSGTTLYIHAQNLFTISNYRGMDPEQGSIGYLPPLKIVSMGVKHTF